MVFSKLHCFQTHKGRTVHETAIQTVGTGCIGFITVTFISLHVVKVMQNQTKLPQDLCLICLLQSSGELAAKEVINNPNLWLVSWLGYFVFQEVYRRWTTLGFTCQTAKD